MVGSTNLKLLMEGCLPETRHRTDRCLFFDVNVPNVVVNQLINADEWFLFPKLHVSFVDRNVNGFIVPLEQGVVNKVFETSV